MIELTTPRARRAVRAAAASIVALGLSTTAAVGQIPDGYFAVSAANNPRISNWAGPGGIYVGHPRTPGDMRYVGGLPQQLTGIPNTGTSALGARAIVIDPGSGDVFVGETGPLGTPIHVWRLSLNGLTVAAWNSWLIGTSGNPQSNGAVGQLALLPGGRILAACYYIQDPSGSYWRGSLWIIDPNPGAAVPVQRVPTSRPLQMTYAMCVDPAGTTAYIAEWSAPRSVHSVSLQTGVVTPVVQMANQAITQLALEADGDQLIAACGYPPAIHRIQLSTGAILTPLSGLAPGWSSLNALTIEPATGNLIFNARNGSTGAYGIFWLPPTGGAPTFLSNTGPGGSAAGNPLGLAAVPDPTRYGAPSTCPASGPTFTWSSAPNPNGLPLIGCPFYAAVDNSSGATVNAAACMISFARPFPGPLSFPGLPLDVWIAPGAMFLPVDLPTTSPLCLSISSIPLVPGLVGRSVFLQTFIVTGSSAIAATDGLELTFL